MIYTGKSMEEKAALEIASMMCTAARTAPKTKGLDNIVTLVLTGEDIEKLAAKMKELDMRIFGEAGGHFKRDADNILKAQAVVLIGVRRAYYGLPYCSMCGFENCAKCREAGANCAFSPIDLGIALGSAAATAADLRADNRIMFSIGKSAEEMDYPGMENVIWQGIPISISGKNVFFDRKPSQPKKA